MIFTLRVKDTKIRVISARDMHRKERIEYEQESFPNLKPTTQSISLRLPLHLLEMIKVAANRRDIPYQSFIKVWLEEKAKSS